MQKIIIPTDFAENSEKSLSGAILIANKMKLSIELLHVIDSFDYGVNFVINESSPMILSPEILDIKRDEATEAYNNLINKIKPIHSELPPINLSIKTGFVFEVISESIQDPNAFMIVMTDKSQLDYNYRDISKDISKIIQDSNCPVCVFSNTAIFKEPKRIIYATNFLEQDILNITNLAHFAKVFEATIHVVHVSEDPKFEDQLRITGLHALIADECSYENIKYNTIKSDDLLSGIDHFANEIHADMIALMRENKTIFKAFFHSNNTRKIIYKTNLPIIIYQEFID